MPRRRDPRTPHEIQPEHVHAVLVNVAGDGQTLDDSAVKAHTAGDTLQDAWGSAAEAKSAYGTFWSSRDDVGIRISDTLLHQASCVAEAADAFIASDGAMSDKAREAMSEISTVSAPEED